MRIKFITCSGTNETTSIYRLARLLREFPMAEIGIQVSEEQCIQNRYRLPWIYAFYAYVKNYPTPINAALHVNRGWVENFGQGYVDEHLEGLLNLKDGHDRPFFKRVQLNFKIGREKTPDFNKLCNLIEQYSDHRFILSYNESNKELIEHMYDRGLMFDLLYDGSFGKGIVPSSRPSPVFSNILQGYAGGIGPDNVAAVLDDIYASWLKSPNNAGIYIDAQRKLEDENEHLDLELCRRYLQNATAWRPKST